LRAIYSAMIAGGFAVCAPITANAESSANIVIRAHVPQVCVISAATIEVPEGNNSFQTTVIESCNGGQGYSILASHRSLTDQETAELSYGGQNVPLQATGLTNVTTRYGASHERINVIVDGKQLQQPLAINLSVTPI